MSNTMAPTAIAPLSNGDIGSTHHHHHSLHHYHHPSNSMLGSTPGPCLLFPMTPISGDTVCGTSSSSSSSNSSAASNQGSSVSQSSPTTAFPFPPPSPGYLSASSVSSTSSSSVSSLNHHLQHQLSSWISPSNSIQALALLKQQHEKLSCKNQASTIAANGIDCSSPLNPLTANKPLSDSNNNELLSKISLNESQYSIYDDHHYSSTNERNKDSNRSSLSSSLSAFKPIGNLNNSDSIEKSHFSSLNDLIAQSSESSSHTCENLKISSDNRIIGEQQRQQQQKHSTTSSSKTGMLQIDRL